MKLFWKLPRWLKCAARIEQPLIWTQVLLKRGQPQPILCATHDWGREVWAATARPSHHYRVGTDLWALFSSTGGRGSTKARWSGKAFLIWWHLVCSLPSGAKRSQTAIRKVHPGRFAWDCTVWAKPGQVGPLVWRWG